MSAHAPSLAPLSPLFMIAAMDRNRLIGAGNRMSWHLPEDLKYFKRVTSGHPVVMGRKTYESIGRLLPGRENRIVSRQAGYEVPGARVFGSVAEACAGENAGARSRGLGEVDRAGAAVLASEGLVSGSGEVFVIGGAEVYAQALPLATRLYLTMIDSAFAGGDAYFPEWRASDFREISREAHEPDPAAGRAFGFSFVVLERWGRGPTHLRPPPNDCRKPAKNGG